jgi:hypothetical protein
MTGWRKRTIMEMAQEVKMPYDFVTGEPINIEKLEAFAALVSEDEREACAAKAEQVGQYKNQLAHHHRRTEMKTQTEAQRLADEMLSFIDGPAFHAPHYSVRQSAAELRRLDAENAKLIEQRDLLLEAPAWVELTDEEISHFDVDPIEAKALIAKLKEKNT